jgi:hypothetical protein
MPTTSTSSVDQLKRAIEIAEQIQQLEGELSEIVRGLGGRPVADSKPAVVITATKTRRRKKRTMSPEARERIAAAQRARWAKQKARS